ncbi:MAG: hypothetical protein JKX81_04395 [Arenicella sp.]|nr:hypothetical protein [Arenicella sp.]
MNPTKHLSKILLTTSVAAVMALSSAVALAQPADDSRLNTYTDPVTGELKIAPKLLSQMTEAEKAALSAEEVKFLKDIEAQIEKEKKEVNQ